MIPKEAIERAIEGGWRHGVFIVQGDDRRNAALAAKEVARFREWQKIALDPTFWQALGKALGWWRVRLREYRRLNDEVLCDRQEIPEWRLKQSDFTDLILTGGDTAAFWQSLLTSKE